MRPLIAKIKPASGFSQLAHVGSNVLLAVLVFVLVRMEFVQLALALILLSKWRMFAVRPRFWPVNIRANSVDIIVSVSLLLFMAHSAGSQWLQLMWMGAYILWLVAVKPASSALAVATQAMIGLLLGLTALFVGWGGGALYWLVLATALICYMSARHFFDSFDEPYARLLSYMWAYFAGGLVWVLGHWLLFYGFMAQPTLLLVALGYALGTIYYLDHYERLTKKWVRVEIFITTSAIVVSVIVSLMVNVTSTAHTLLR